MRDESGSLVGAGGACLLLPLPTGTPLMLFLLRTLAEKVFKKLGLQYGKDDLEGVCQCRPGVVERVLNQLQSQARGWHTQRRQCPLILLHTLPVADPENQGIRGTPAGPQGQA